MDPLQTRALNALAPFVVLSKAATSTRAACELITQATSHPETYVFAELLALPPIQSLRTSPSPGPSFYHLLEIFSWGTYADYKGTPHILFPSPPRRRAANHTNALTHFPYKQPTPASQPSPRNRPRSSVSSPSPPFSPHQPTNPRPIRPF